MRKLKFTREVVANYYNGDFANDLRRYFDITHFSIPNINFIPRMDYAEGRRLSGSPASNGFELLTVVNNRTQDTFQNEVDITTRNYIFSGLFYFMLLIPQTIRELYGKESEYDLYRSSGWPYSSAGLGGSLPPDKMLREADLFPIDIECENYSNMLEIVSSFMIKQIQEFLTEDNSPNLNSEAYQRLKDVVNIQEFISRLIYLSMEFSEMIKKGNVSE